MKKSTRTPAKPPARPAMRPCQLDDTDFAKVIGGCTNENLTEAVIRSSFTT